MTFRKIAVTIILFLCSSCFSSLFAQKTLHDFSKLKALMDVDMHKHHYSLKGTHSEEEAAVTGLFIIYKSFFSSQDGYSCTFSPSCSEYAIQSVKKKGLIIGLMNASDRLLRCNGLSPKNYPYDPEKHLLIDPVD